MSIWDTYKDQYFNVSYPTKKMITDSLMKEMETFIGTKKQIEAKEQEIMIAVNDEYNNLKKEYYNSQNKILEMFVNDLYASCQKDIPQVIKEKAWHKAYELGHSAGYHEVENYFSEIVYEYFDIYNIGKNSK